MNSIRLQRSLTIAAMMLLTAIATGAEPILPADRPIAEVIDHYINLKLKDANVSRAPQADDHTLVRRLYLDLAGRIPTAGEARDFVDSTDSQKREKLVERLMALPEYVRHNATEFDQLLRNYNPEAPSVRDYLLLALRENRSWNRDVPRTARRASICQSPGIVSYREVKDPDALMGDVSSVFFGINISCAERTTPVHLVADTGLLLWSESVL